MDFIICVAFAAVKYLVSVSFDYVDFFGVLLFHK